MNRFFSGRMLVCQGGAGFEPRLANDCQITCVYRRRDEPMVTWTIALLRRLAGNDDRTPQFADPRKRSSIQPTPSTFMCQCLLYFSLTLIITHAFIPQVFALNINSSTGRFTHSSTSSTWVDAHQILSTASCHKHAFKICEHRSFARQWHQFGLVTKLRRILHCASAQSPIPYQLLIQPQWTARSLRPSPRSRM